MISVSDKFDYDIYKKIVKIWEEVDIWKPERKDNYEVIRKTLEFGGKIFSLIFNDETIGACWVTNDNRRLYLHHFAISKKYQKQEFAKYLLEATINYATKINLSIKLEVHQSNIPAKKLYKKAGFVDLEGYQIKIKR